MGQVHLLRYSISHSVYIPFYNELKSGEQILIKLNMSRAAARRDVDKAEALRGQKRKLFFIYICYILLGSIMCDTKP